MHVSFRVKYRAHNTINTAANQDHVAYRACVTSLSILNAFIFVARNLFNICFIFFIHRYRIAIFIDQSKSLLCSQQRLLVKYLIVNVIGFCTLMHLRKAISEVPIVF